jgi:hypothetical protein
MIDKIVRGMMKPISTIALRSGSATSASAKNGHDQRYEANYLGDIGSPPTSAFPHKTRRSAQQMARRTRRFDAVAKFLNVDLVKSI